MSETVADLLWRMLAEAGVKRCYGIVGDALNPTIDALRRNGKVEFIHVRHEEYGVFAGVADAYLTGNPVAVCGTAGPGVVHLFNGLMDARKEGAPIIAIAGDVETSLMDTAALEELNPYQFFEAASLYTGRLVNPEQARPIISTAILTALIEKGPTVIAIPGDVASADAPGVVVDAVVDPFALSLPSHVPFHAAKGFTLSMAKQVWTGRMDAVVKTITRNVKLV
jgi:pyruvate dehydrogenase (quinone)